MIWTGLPLPAVWAQAAGSTGVGSNPGALALAPLALRRWCASLTLASPESVPSFFGLWTWLAGLGSLLLVAAVFQGPGRALRQLFDLAGHARLARDATRRLRKAVRMFSAIVGLTVLSWTGSQALTYSRLEGRDDALMLTRARALGELAVEQGMLAALTPLRDVAGLGSNLPLLIVATLLIFRASADLWGGAVLYPPLKPGSPRISGWVHVAWTSATLFILYRLVAIGSGASELPLGGCLMVEAVVIPTVMAISDGILLGWVLVELRNAEGDGPDGEALDTRGAIHLMPASVLAALVALPARYVATAVLLGSIYLPSSVNTSAVGSWLRWQLSWGLTEVQAASLVGAGLAGAVAWGNGGLGASLWAYGRLLKGEGARLVVVLALAGLAAGAASTLAYALILSLPAATWVLNAADSYAHYGSLPAGLWALSALVELGARARPPVGLAEIEDTSVAM